MCVVCVYVCVHCVHRGLSTVTRVTTLPSSLVSVAHFVFTLHFLPFPLFVSISEDRVGEWRSMDSKRREETIGLRYEDFVTWVRGGCKLVLSFLSALPLMNFEILHLGTLQFKPITTVDF